MTDNGIPVDDDMLTVLRRETKTAATPLDTPDGDIAVDPDVFTTQPGKNGGTLIRLGFDEASREKAREMQRKSREPYREGRERRTAESKALAAEIMQAAKDSVETAGGGKGQSIEAMADKTTRMMLSVILNGGELFVPTSAKEAMEIAKMANAISATQRAGRAADRIIDAGSRESLPDQVIDRMSQIKAELQARQAERATKAGE